MSKLAGLVEYLAALPSDRHEVRLSFAQMDGLIHDPLPAYAAQHQYWHGPRPHVDALRRAGWSAHLDPKAREVSFRRTGGSIARTVRSTAVEATLGARVCTVNRGERIRDLMQNLPEYVAAFGQRQSSRETAVFTTEQVRCHKVTLQRLDAVGLRGVLSRRETEFYELLYATLKAWGMHKRKAKLVALDELRSSMLSNADALTELQGLNLRDLDASAADAVARQLANLMQCIKVSGTGTKMVAFTKALHHLLPGLVPPMDREYTMWFFYYPVDKTSPIDGHFPDVYRWCASIASANRDVIPGLVSGFGDLTSGVFDTGEAKLVDNAIIEYVTSEMPRRPRWGELREGSGPEHPCTPRRLFSGTACSEQAAVTSWWGRMEK